MNILLKPINATPILILLYTIFLPTTTLLAQIEESFSIEIKNILQQPLSSRIELRDSSNQIVHSYPIPKGKLEATATPGEYTAYIFVYDNDVPYGVSIQPLTILKGTPAHLSYELLEGSGPNEFLEQFDADGDLFISRVELSQHTDPSDPLSIPGLTLHAWPEQQFNTQPAWYRGELHAQSNYGRGKESVPKLIKRAESLKLDFLSILDRNTLDSALDEKYKSKSMVLIPGIEWGNDEKGVALVYAPLFLPQEPKTDSDMIAYTRVLQSQGALIFAGHPCFPRGVWNWPGVAFNGVEAWCMGWGNIPPIGLNSIHEDNRSADTITINKKESDGTPYTETRTKYKHSIALAAAMSGVSANTQAAAFWDLEMSRGFRLGMIGGSQTASPKVPMAQPVTYVYANDKSLNGILDAIHKGRTYVSRGLNGPTIDWIADVFDDGKIDVMMGGEIPIDQTTRFYTHIRGAANKKLVLLKNGVQATSMTIPTDNWIFEFEEHPENYTVYRLNILEPASQKQPFGFNNMLLMTSPIYAKGVIPENIGTGTREWVAIKSTNYISQDELNAFARKLEKVSPPSDNNFSR